MPTINKQSCPTCGQSVNEREIGLFKGMVTALYEVWRWCEKNNVQDFTRKYIKHLFKDENQIARFGDWALFGLVRKEAKGKYTLSFNRVRSFFAGKMMIPTVAYKNPLQRSIAFDNYKYVHEIKGLNEFLDENNDFIARYR